MLGKISMLFLLNLASGDNLYLSTLSIIKWLFLE